LLPLKILPMPVEIPTINWHIQWHTYRDADPGLKWLREQMLEIAQQNRPEYSMPMSA